MLHLHNKIKCKELVEVDDENLVCEYIVPCPHEKCYLVLVWNNKKGLYLFKVKKRLLSSYGKYKFISKCTKEDNPYLSRIHNVTDEEAAINVFEKLKNEMVVIESDKTNKNRCKYIKERYLDTCLFKVLMTMDDKYC